MRRALKWTGIGCGCLLGLAVAGLAVLVAVGLWVGPRAPAISSASPTPAVAANAPAQTIAPVAVATERPTVSVANSTPLPTPPAIVTATRVPTPTVPPATYEWVSVEPVPAQGRQRFRVAIVMPAEYTDDQLVRAFRGAINRTFREQATAKAVVVFGHSSRAEISKGADLGSAWASSDRLGWAGDRKLESLADDGKIVVNIGSAFTARPQSKVAVDRTGP